MADMNDDDLLDALGVEVPTLKTTTRTPREERIIAGFEDIQRFYWPAWIVTAYCQAVRSPL